MAAHSLRGRILLGATVVNLLVFAAAGSVLLFNARGAAQTEIIAAQTSAEALIRSTLLMNTPASAADFAARFARLEQPRHVRISIGPATLPAAAPASGAPLWFHRWIAPEIAPVTIAVPHLDNSESLVHVLAQPDDEIAEVWEDVRGLILIWGTAAVLQMALLALIVGRALRPVDRLNARLVTIGNGDLASRIGPVGSPDLAPLAQRIDALAETLERERAERKRIAKRLLEARDSERREIARDLHDELGPCLFGLTVEADALRTAPEQDVHIAAILRHVAAIRTINRRVLDTVRPATLGRLPLEDVVHDLVGDLIEMHRGLEIRTSLPADLPSSNETVTLSIYRAIQEGVTNALRHGGARRIRIVLSRAGSAIRLVLRDDGRGLATGWRHGGGLMGMIERAEAIGGAVSIHSTDTGTELTLTLPLEAP